MKLRHFRFRICPQRFSHRKALLVITILLLNQGYLLSRRSGTRRSIHFGLHREEVHAIYLNDDFRRDRDRQISDQLNKAGLAYTRISSIRVKEQVNADSCFWNRVCALRLSCQLSHMRALQYALQTKVMYAVIVEDDFVWSPSTNPEYVFRIIAAVAKEYADWDVLGLSLNIKKYVLPKHQVQVYTSSKDKADIVRIIEAEDTRAYVVKQSYISDMYERFRSCDILGSPRNSIDLCWKPLQSTGKWYGIIPQLGYGSAQDDLICPSL